MESIESGAARLFWFWGRDAKVCISQALTLDKDSRYIYITTTTTQLPRGILALHGIGLYLNDLKDAFGTLWLKIEGDFLRSKRTDSIIHQQKIIEE